jgi:hypothetical protein
MKIDTPEKYLARYRKRGEKPGARKASRQLHRLMEELHLIGFDDRPRHEERTVNIESCFPLFEFHGKPKPARYYDR